MCSVTQNHTALTRKCRSGFSLLPVHVEPKEALSVKLCGVRYVHIIIIFFSMTLLLL